MVGRKPKPSALRLLEGNRGKRPVNDKEPTPQIGCDKPSFLTGRPSEVWDELAPRLTRLGVLTETDGPMFAALCLLIAEMEQDPGNFKQFGQLRQYAGLFGMEPSSRARIVAYPPEGGDSRGDRAKLYPI
jgi:phage terminase small subunit